MAGEIQTPTCAATKLPLPVLPITEPDAARFSFWDYHHHFHPRSSAELTEVDGKAMRYSRGQLLPRIIHNYYHQIFSGPELPTDVSEKFRLTVLSCAGVVPRQAIAIASPGDYVVVTLDNDSYRHLSDPSSIYIEKANKVRGRYFTRNAIGRFFASYALSQNLSTIVSERVIDQFLDSATAESRKKELGNFILNEALGVSIDGVEKEHRELASNGYVGEARRTAPRELVRKFFTKNHYPEYHDEVARIISAAA